ncbi:MAG: AAA family ATPase [Planctomycetaceae bacterium]|jgi:type II secretory pathway predicted ATPase ExeA|nr:AAA family ATPase [Planctomycetaceae bacterium]
MSHTYFSLEKRPFLSIPDTETYFPAESIENARKTIVAALERDAGVAVVFGEHGVGKSLLLKMIGRHFEMDNSIIYIANPGIKTPKAMYQQILFGLQQPYCGLEENELRLLLWNYLHQYESLNIVLLIDEAQTLGHKALEELRVLLHCDDGKSTKIKLVLAGSLNFEEKLANPKLSAFQQRIVSRSYLDRFLWSETEEYLMWQLKESGKNEWGSIFTQEAGKRIHKLTEGLPRLINQLAGESLVLAGFRKLREIDEKIVQESWGILQQIPTETVRHELTENTQTGEMKEIENSDTLEFSELSEDDSDENEEFAKNKKDNKIKDIEENKKNVSDFQEKTTFSRKKSNEIPQSGYLPIPVQKPALNQNPTPSQFQDFLTEMRVMEATLFQDFSPASNKQSASKSPALPRVTFTPPIQKPPIS